MTGPPRPRPRAPPPRLGQVGVLAQAHRHARSTHTPPRSAPPSRSAGRSSAVHRERGERQSTPPTSAPCAYRSTRNWMRSFIAPPSARRAPRATPASSARGRDPARAPSDVHQRASHDDAVGLPGHGREPGPAWRCRSRRRSAAASPAGPGRSTSASPSASDAVAPVTPETGDEIHEPLRALDRGGEPRRAGRRAR